MKKRLFALLGACLLAVSAVTGCSNGGGTGAARDSVYGSFLLSPEAGGYVLAAVIAFALGVAVTLFCLKRKKLSSEDKKKEDIP